MNEKTNSRMPFCNASRRHSSSRAHGFFFCLCVMLCAVFFACTASQTSFSAAVTAPEPAKENAVPTTRTQAGAPSATSGESGVSTPRQSTAPKYHGKKTRTQRRTNKPAPKTESSAKKNQKATKRTQPKEAMSRPLPGKEAAAEKKPASLAKPAPVPAPAPDASSMPSADVHGEKGEVASFTLPNVEHLARELAAKPYDVPQTPEYLRALSYEQWTQLRFREEHTLWRKEQLPFEVQFFHPGSVYSTPVRIHIVDEGKISDVAFSPDMFMIDSPELAEKLRGAPLDFAGFRLLFPIRGGIHRDEIASFLGATYFRALSRDAGYGLSGLGLSVNTAVPGAEEFPVFREFWLVKPAPGSTSLKIFALMDAPSMTGAYVFELTPGETTFMDVTCTLFERPGAKGSRKLGIAPLSSMFLSGGEPVTADTPFKPEVHNSDGLLLKNDEGNWLWSPLNNPKRLETFSFRMNNPRGFGLMQRDATFAHYQDVTARYDLRPSLWVEPRSPWGEGHLELIEIPTNTVIHNNVLAFWVPDTPRLFSAEHAAPEAWSYAYRLHWMRPGASPHSLGRIEDTQMAVSSDGTVADFIVNFVGDELNAIPADTGLFCPLELPENVTLVEKKLVKNPETNGWTLSFQVRLPKDEGLLQNILPNRPTLPPLRFKAILKKGENLPDPLTETWNFDLSR